MLFSVYIHSIDQSLCSKSVGNNFYYTPLGFLSLCFSPMLSSKKSLLPLAHCVLLWEPIKRLAIFSRIGEGKKKQLYSIRFTPVTGIHPHPSFAVCCVAISFKKEVVPLCTLFHDSTLFHDNFEPTYLFC